MDGAFVFESPWLFVGRDVAQEVDVGAVDQQVELAVAVVVDVTPLVGARFSRVNAAGDVDLAPFVGIAGRKRRIDAHRVVGPHIASHFRLTAIVAITLRRDDCRRNRTVVFRTMLSGVQAAGGRPTSRGVSSIASRPRSP